MKVWAKRMIWYFGNMLIIKLSNITYYLREEKMGNGIILVWLCILVIPLFFFKDDKGKKK